MVWSLGVCSKYQEVPSGWCRYQIKAAWEPFTHKGHQEWLSVATCLWAWPLERRLWKAVSYHFIKALKEHVIISRLLHAYSTLRNIFIALPQGKYHTEMQSSGQQWEVPLPLSWKKKHIKNGSNSQLTSPLKNKQCMYVNEKLDAVK